VGLTDLAALHGSFHAGADRESDSPLIIQATERGIFFKNFFLELPTEDSFLLRRCHF